MLEVELSSAVVLGLLAPTNVLDLNLVAFNHGLERGSKVLFCRKSDQYESPVSNTHERRL
jgi:hypothetical protein